MDCHQSRSVVILRFLVLHQQLQHLNQHLHGIADDRNIGVHRFGDRSRIDIDVQHGGVRAVFSEVIGGAIVEAHADGEDHVGMVHGFVGFIGAVHAEHADALAMGAGESAQSHQAAGHRQVQLLRQRQQFGLATGVDRAAADVHHRLLAARMVCNARLICPRWPCTVGL